MKKIRDGKKMVWNENLRFPMTVAYDNDSHRVVIFTAAGEKLKGKEGLMMPIIEENPFKIPDMYGASVSAMAEVIIQESAKDFLMEMAKMMGIDTNNLDD